MTMSKLVDVVLSNAIFLNLKTHTGTRIGEITLIMRDDYDEKLCKRRLEVTGDVNGVLYLGMEWLRQGNYI